MIKLIDETGKTIQELEVIITPPIGSEITVWGYSESEGVDVQSTTIYVVTGQPRVRIEKVSFKTLTKIEIPVTKKE